MEVPVQLQEVVAVPDPHPLALAVAEPRLVRALGEELADLIEGDDLEAEDAPVVRAVCRVLKETACDLAIAVADGLEGER